MSVPNYQQPPGPAGEATFAPPPAAGARPAVLTQAPSGMMVSYTAEPLANRAAMLRSAMRRRIFSVVLSAIISVVYFLIFRPEVGSFFFWLLLGSVIYSVLLLVWSIVQVVWTRKLIGKVPLGPAFQIDNHGVVISSNPLGERLDWSQVRLIKGRNRIFNPGPQLQFGHGENTVWSVPIIMLDAAPQAIDSALRAFSRGRFGFDLSSVDEIW